MQIAEYRAPPGCRLGFSGAHAPSCTGGSVEGSKIKSYKKSAQRDTASASRSVEGSPTTARKLVGGGQRRNFTGGN